MSMVNKLKLVITLNYSSYIYVECVEEGSFPITAHHLDTLSMLTQYSCKFTFTEERIVPPVTFRSGSDSNTSSNKVNFAVSILRLQQSRLTIQTI